MPPAEQPANSSRPPGLEPIPCACDSDCGGRGPVARGCGLTAAGGQSAALRGMARGGAHRSAVHALGSGRGFCLDGRGHDALSAEREAVRRVRRGHVAHPAAAGAAFVMHCGALRSKRDCWKGAHRSLEQYFRYARLAPANGFSLGLSLNSPLCAICGLHPEEDIKYGALLNRSEQEAESKQNMAPSRYSTHTLELWLFAAAAAK